MATVPPANHHADWPEGARISSRCITRFAVGKLKTRVMPVAIRPALMRGELQHLKFRRSFSFGSVIKNPGKV